MRDARLTLSTPDQEITSARGLWSDRERINDDDMRPLPIANLMVEVSGYDATAYWTKSPDLDVSKYMIEIRDERNRFDQYYVSPNESKYTFVDLQT